MQREHPSALFCKWQAEKHPWFPAMGMRCPDLIGSAFAHSRAPILLCSGAVRGCGQFRTTSIHSET